MFSISPPLSSAGLVQLRVLEPICTPHRPTQHDLAASSAHPSPRNIDMKCLILIAAAAALTTGAAAAAERPTYQAQGFPITSHQVAMLGAAGVEEQAAAAI